MHVNELKSSNKQFAAYIKMTEAGNCIQTFANN